MGAPVAPVCGDTYGLHLPLLAKGTEVSIAFEEGNPDRPYIAGVKHDSAHTDHVTIQNDKRNVLHLPTTKIRLDDERGKEHIKGQYRVRRQNQLNPRSSGGRREAAAREGFELRTDLVGRGAGKEGIFISADAQD
ncbi:type VI secretion protein VgrG, partial [Escherichia coli]|nr:type VI secretion protein VgrG [Escherichia coli]